MQSIKTIGEALDHIILNYFNVIKYHIGGHHYVGTSISSCFSQYLWHSEVGVSNGKKVKKKYNDTASVQYWSFNIKERGKCHCSTVVKPLCRGKMSGSNPICTKLRPIFHQKNKNNKNKREFYQTWAITAAYSCTLHLHVHKIQVYTCALAC